MQHMNSDLSAFVKEALAKGISKEDIRSKLSAAGWRQDEVSTALAAYADMDFPVPIPRPRPYLSAREAFLYLVMFMTLYISAFSVGTILFQLINRAFPDPVLGSYYLQSTTELIRQATASLIIAFPVFVLVSWIINRSQDQRAEKRSSRVRKWLTYLTLFIGAGIIIGTLIGLVSNLLSGELTTRFILKVLVTLVITASLFGYYLLDLQKEEVHA
jgi:hypothetical protein